MNEMEVFGNNRQETYLSIRNSVIAAQSKVYTAVNSTMVNAYWEIGEQIYKACGENDRAEYGKKLLEFLSEKLTAEFGKGYSVQGLRNMRQFYCTSPIRSTLWSELSWSHYRVLMRISDKTVREFYTEECARSAWSVRQLERRYIQCIIKDCLQAVIKKALRRKFRPQSLNPNTKKLSKTHM